METNVQCALHSPFVMVLLWAAYMPGLEALRGIYPQYQTLPLPEDTNVGDPVMLTPYIERGELEEGRAAAAVKPVKANVRSYSGFLTVNKKYNSTMFFWYFPSEEAPESAPVVVWLQGGPGASSLFGLFSENGPFYVKKERGLKMRDYYWSQVVNVIYIDNPVGTGFSYTDDPAGYATDEMAVGKDLYSAVSQFLQLFPQLQKNPFFVTGESYAGKYVPALTYAIHTNNLSPKVGKKINLQGMAIGNGLCDPESMLNYGDYLYQIGLIDSNAKQIFVKKQQEIVMNIQQKNYNRAFELFDMLLNGDLTPYKSYFYNQTGFTFYFNYLHNQDDSPYGDIGAYVQKAVMRRSIHVGNKTFHTDNKVELALKGDVMQTVKPWIEVLIEKYRVLVYNGQLDIIVPYPLTVNFLRNLDWSGKNVYKSAPRKEWWVGSQLAGYSKTVKGFTELLVRNAGHMVPMDQPQIALDLISRFTFNKPF